MADTDRFCGAIDGDHGGEEFHFEETGRRDRITGDSRYAAARTINAGGEQRVRNGRAVPEGWWKFAAAAGTVMAVRAAFRMARAISFKGRVVLITGGARGLGLGMARMLADQGAKLALCARSEDDLREAEAELTGRGAEVLTVVCDVTDEDDVELMIGSVIERFGQLDVLINNAGVITVGPMNEMTKDDFDVAMKTHFWAPLHCTLAALPWLRKVQGGQIVNISSIGGLTAVPHMLPYSASKFALAGLSEGLRSELAKDGITVTSVFPGLVQTGSNLNANFKGQNEKEYTLFTLFFSLPGNSVSAEAACRRILNACRVGDAHLVIGGPSQFGAVFHGVFPGLTADLWSIVNRFMPAEGGIGKRAVPGKASETPLSRSPMTQHIEKAAVDLNER